MVSTVSDYHSALAATHIGSITSQNDVNKAISRANSFKRDPLKNCTSLMHAIDGVGSKARSALEAYNRRQAEARNRAAAAEEAAINERNNADNQESIPDNSNNSADDDVNFKF